MSAIEERIRKLLALARQQTRAKSARISRDRDASANQRDRTADARDERGLPRADDSPEGR